MSRFDMDRDVLMVFQNESRLKFSPDSADILCNIVLLSYNRPRMLKEALLSVLGQSYPNFKIHLLDDGSDIFDPTTLIDEFKDERILLYSFPAMDPRSRASSSRVADNINTSFENMGAKELIF